MTHQTNQALEALKKIADPITYFQSQVPAGDTLNGFMAVQLANDPEWLKGVAREAIAALTSSTVMDEKGEALEALKKEDDQLLTVAYMCGFSTHKRLSARDTDAIAHEIAYAIQQHFLHEMSDHSLGEIKGVISKVMGPRTRRGPPLGSNACKLCGFQDYAAIHLDRDGLQDEHPGRLHRFQPK